MMKNMLSRCLDIAGCILLIIGDVCLYTGAERIGHILVEIGIACCLIGGWRKKEE